MSAHVTDTADLIAVSAIVVGFGVTAMMFRVQRELYVLEVLKIETLWLAWADYTIIASVMLAVFGATVPLLVFPTLPESVIALSASSCVGAVILQAGYIPSILAHYRIEIGTARTGSREKGEPAERLFVIGAFIIAGIAFVITFCLRMGVL